MGMNISLIGHSTRFSEVREELAANPHLWGRNTGRTALPNSPHRDSDDIWVCGPDYTQHCGDVPSPSYWFEDADLLPKTVKLVGELYGALGGTHLSTILITRIPAGKCIYPHVDTGYHAETFEKFAVSIKANALQRFSFQDDGLVTQPGDIFTFNNQVLHWVDNPSDEERITLIFTIRRKPCQSGC